MLQKNEGHIGEICITEGWMGDCGGYSIVTYIEIGINKCNYKC